jgi:membrane protein YdbS with pleckstrin-like domain
MAVEDAAVPVSATVLVEDATKACPACGETIKAVALKCRFCGEDLRAFTARQHALQEQQEALIEKTLFQGSPAIFYDLTQYFLAVVSLGLMALVYWQRSRAVRYLITTQRITVETGTFSKHVDMLEAFRVDHIEIDKPFGMRLLGYGILRVRTSDKAEDRLVIYGVKQYEQLAEQIRQNLLRERERRGIRSMVQV